MQEAYLPRVANLVSKLTILPSGQYSGAAPILQMLNGLPILLQIDSVGKRVAKGLLDATQLEERLNKIEEAIGSHCQVTGGDSRIYTLIEAYSDMLRKIGLNKIK